MKILVNTAVWGMGDQALAGGEHDVEVTDATAPLIAGAEATGAIAVVEATDAERAALASHIQTQAGGEAAYAAAQENGSWAEGQAAQVAVEAADAVAAAPATEAGA